MGLSNVPVIGRLASALGPIPAALGAAASASPEMRDALGELWETSQPLIDALGDVAVIAAGIFTEGVGLAADTLQLALDIIGPVVDGFGALPDPIQNATVMLGAFIATRKLMPNFADQMDRGFGAIQTGIGNALDAFQPWGGKFEGAAADALTFRSKLNIVTTDLGRTAAQGFRGAINGVMGLFGGPWGVALATATTAIGFWAQEQAEAKARVDELRGSLDEQTGAFTRSTEEMVANEILQATNMETLEAMGLTLTDVTDAILYGGDAYDHVNGRIQAYGDELGEKGLKIDEVQDKLLPLEQLIRSESDAVEEATAAEQLAIESKEQLADETDEAKRAQEEFAEAIVVASDETNTMEQRVRGLKDALDVLNGAEKSAEQAARDLYDSQQTLGEFIAGVAEESGGLASGLWDIDEGMATISEEGNRFSEMMARHEEDMLAAAIAAYDKAGGDENAAEAAAAAAEEYDKQVGALEDLLIQSGMSEEEVAALIETMEKTPEQINFAVSGNATDVEVEVQRLTNTIDALPDGDTHITDNATSQNVIDILEDLGYEVETLPDGRIKVTSTGVDATIEEIEEAARGPYNATIRTQFLLTGPSPGGNHGVPYAPGKEPSSTGGKSNLGREYSTFPRHDGGIDIMGMAAGDITPASVMDVAQFVKPGDIRFAGDRSDVDEAWIPLDGSRRSIAILREAMARMPGFNAEGMAAGGITGNLTPPQVESVDAPDTAELENVWQSTMDALEESTRSSFTQIESDTTASQAATTATTASQMGAMRDITAQQLALMVALTSQNMSAMDATTAANLASMQSDTDTYTSRMQAATGQNLSRMESDTGAYTTSMRDTTAARFQAMQQDASSKADVLRYNVSRQLYDMHVYGTGQVQGLRAESNTQFTNLRDHGIDAATDLRSGVVSQMGQTRSPFTSRVNDLVDVMRSFSRALNDAYRDMGVDVGTPTRLATGGIMPGYTPGLDVHSFTSPTGGRLELSGGEAVMRPEFTRAVGSDWVHTMNALARTGGVSAIRDMLTGPTQAFASGGIIDEFTSDAKRIARQHKGQLPQNWIRPAGVHTIDEVIKGIEQHFETMMSGEGWVRPTSGRITSPYGASRGGYPHAGIDIAGGHGRVVSATAGIVRETGWNLGPGRTGLGILAEHPGNLYTYSGHAPVGGIRVRPGDPLIPGQHISHQGSTGNSTGDHLHWEVHQMRPWNDVNPMPYWNAAGGTGQALSVMGGGGSDRWAGTVMQALRLVGLPTTSRYANAWLRQIQTESGGNPNAIQRVNDINMRLGRPARGLVQVIPPTFAAHHLPGMGNIMNPLHNLAAGMNYAKNRYGVAGMLNAIGQGRGYKLGTRYAQDGWHMVGENGAELVNFKGGETVLNHRQSRSALASGINEDSLARKIAQEFVKVAPRGGQVHITGPLTNEARQLAGAVGKTVRRELNKLDRAGAR
jgi:SLT domain-containing protein/murein DD-endopeptidase MepM/ murein hydrolase activator NlpD